MHHVRTADPVLLVLTAVAEVEDPRVLQEPADDRADGDVLAQAGNSGPQCADAAHRHVDLDTGPRRAVERVDHLLVDDRVHLQPHQAAATVALVVDLAFDAGDDAAADGVRGDQQVAVLGLPRVPGQHVEQVGQVGADVGVGRQQARDPRRCGRSWGCSCRSRCGSTGAGSCPPAGSPARSCSAS